MNTWRSQGSVFSALGRVGPEPGHGTRAGLKAGGCFQEGKLASDRRPSKWSLETVDLRPAVEFQEGASGRSCRCGVSPRVGAEIRGAAGSGTRCDPDETRRTRKTVVGAPARRPRRVSHGGGRLTEGGLAPRSQLGACNPRPGPGWGRWLPAFKAATWSLYPSSSSL